MNTKIVLPLTAFVLLLALTASHAVEGSSDFENNLIESNSSSVEDFSVELNEIREDFSNTRDPKSLPELAVLDDIARNLVGVNGFGGNKLGAFGNILGLKAIDPSHVKLALKVLTLAFPFIFSFLPQIKARVSNSIESNAFTDMSSNLARHVVSSQHCVERICCEIGRSNHGNFIDRPVSRLVHKFHRLMPFFFRRSVGAYLDRRSCEKYRCGLLEAFHRVHSLA